MSCPGGLTDPCPGDLSGAGAQVFVSLLSTLLASKCSINDEDQYPANYAPFLEDQSEFDFIIVGAGTAGPVVANKLSENPDWEVLVLEAGSFPSLTTEIPGIFNELRGTDEDWQYIEGPGTDGRVYRHPVGKVLGGTSSINGLNYVRGSKGNFDGWAAAGNEGWDYDSILPHFLEFERFQGGIPQVGSIYGRNGYLGVTTYTSDEPIYNLLREGVEEVGVPSLQQQDTIGFFEPARTIENGTRSNSAKAFLGKVKDRKNLKVAVNVFVERLVINEDKVVEGVVVNVGNNVITLRARKEVILSAGVFNSPKILLLSGIGPADHLEDLGIPLVNDLSVGRNFHDHYIFGGFSMNLTGIGLKTVLGTDEYYEYFAHRDGPVAKPIEMQGYINTRDDPTVANIQYLCLIQGGEADANSGMEATNSSGGLLMMANLVQPKSRGVLTLQSTDPYDQPIFSGNYLSDPDDVEVILEAVRFSERVSETEAFRRFNATINGGNPLCDEFEFRSDDYWKCNINNGGGTDLHTVGTCKMGPSTDTEAVVDPRLRVYGVEHLRVIDASIMPLVTSSNVMASIYLIGQKGGSMIVEDWS